MTTDEAVVIPRFVSDFLTKMHEAKLTIEQRKAVGKLLYYFTKRMEDEFTEERSDGTFF